ncbi:MAG: methyltransferase domain-containing protein [Deltaproteobacteria bacterium]|nr:methyltransferase domain-containing protein [Deltaproteobacteria bacterium]
MQFGLIPQSPQEMAALTQSPHIRVLLEPFLPMVTSRALMAFVRLGLPTVLAKKCWTSSELSAELGLREEALSHLLRVLVVAGYVATSDEGASSAQGSTEQARRERQYTLSSLSRRTLLDGSQEQLDAWVLHNEIHWRVISELEESLALDGRRDLHRHLESDQEWAVYQRAMLQTARPVAEAVAQLVPVPSTNWLVLDLGGSHGLYGAAIARRFAPMRCRVIDLPEALPSARNLGEAESISDYVDYEEGDLLEMDLGEAVCDIVFMGNIVHHFTEEEAKELYSRVHRALRPGGVVTIWDMAPPSKFSQPDLVTEAFSLLFYLSSASSVRTPESHARALGAVGFNRAAIHEGLSPTHTLVTALR